MRRSVLEVLCWIMILAFPASLFGGEAAPAAMLYSRGGTVLNGTTVPRSSALFSGDLVQTSADSVANINATGSTVLVLNETVLQYEGDFLKLEHGGITVSTSKSMSAQAGEVRIAPAKSVLTEFEVRDVDGRVLIAARKGDLTISDQDGTTTLAQGQETTKDEESSATSKKRKRNNKRTPNTAAEPGEAGAILNHPVAIGIAGGAIGGLAIWSLTRSDDPVSTSK
jgi:hypothetical protein